VARGAGGQEQERIFFADWIGIFYFAKEARPVDELGFELCANFLANLVATALNAWADGGFEVAGAGAEVAEHFSDAFFDDALEGAAPSGVEDADGAMFGVDQDHGEAVGGLNGEQEAGCGGEESVAGWMVGGGGVDAVDDVGVDLAEGDQGPAIDGGFGFVFLVRTAAR